MGWGKSRAENAPAQVHERGCIFARKTKLELVVPESLASRVVEAISRSAHTGKVGDGKIFVYEVREVVKIRTGERSREAI